MMSSVNRWFAIATVWLCTGWSLVYLLISATSGGKSWYKHVSSKFFDDSKGGVPIIALAIPLLLSATICSLLVVTKSDVPNATSISCWPRQLSAQFRQLYDRFHIPLDLNRAAFIFIFIPCMLYVWAIVNRHASGSHNWDIDDKLMDIGNAFGMMAMIAMSYFLVPVARHGPILAALGMNPAVAVQLHIWTGRIVILGVVLHGVLHMARWWFISGENIISMLVPPKPCWTSADTDFEPECVDSDSDCSCYDHFRNLTGFLALVALLVIGVSSIGYVRRAYYSIFYMVHIAVGPLFLLVTILHWSKMVLFLCPSMLYYAACTAPVLMERWRKYRLRNHKKNGLKISSLKEIRAANNTGGPSSGRLARSCVDLTFEVSQEAIQQYRCGQYVKLSVPEVSALSHPFTVNRVPADPTRMRVLFRVVGPFTSELKIRLFPASSTLEEHALPHMQMDAFYGTQDRLAQVLRHDTVVFVAGGIGITPYLSLLHEIHTLFQNKAQGNTSFGTKKVVLHWICRDVDLIKFIHDEYFLPILHSGASGQNPSCSIQIVIHKTGVDKNSIGNQKSYTDTLTDDAPLGTLDAEHGQSVGESLNVASPNNLNDGMPLVPTRFSSYSKQSITENIPYFGTVASISWVGLFVTWWMYENFVHKHSIRERGYIVVAIVALSFIFAYIANVAMDATTTYGLCFGRSVFRRRRRQRGDGISTAAWWSPLAGDPSKDSEHFDSDDNEEDSPGMVMTDLSLQGSPNESAFADEFQEDSRDQFLGEASIPYEKNTELSEPNEEGVTMESTNCVTMVEKEGRPTAHSLIQSFEDTNNDSSSGGRCEHPGLFMCGPSAMMEDIKDASKTKCSMWLQQCSVGSAPHIT
eukprot:CAMPEP_0198285388 /NCGR_PEP_ID=MMETSP1449-20131203/4693_1 /TAXON_ID=420275 /ORGANISM="Attheya septentrionalis, Strain CCMP2084" /LENGTH=862 /DNA_ID=CAMNT_0043982795 /DNA_START=133 /DNA_END=2718 /DNA_ORIENTATION=+